MVHDYLKGIYNITPFHPDGSLDEVSLAALTRFNIDKGVDGMTILGVMGETPKVAEVRKAKPDMVIFGGLRGMMFLEEMKNGADGTMTGFGFPDILVDIHRKYTSGDIDGATETFYRYCPLIRFEAQDGISMPLRKEIYARRGAIASAQVRRPYPTLDEGTLRDLDDLLTRLELQGN